MIKDVLTTVTSDQARLLLFILSIVDYALSSNDAEDLKRYNELATLIRQMVIEKRNPTDEEWNTIITKLEVNKL